jgi:hypothetical protein
LHVWKHAAGAGIPLANKSSADEEFSLETTRADEEQQHYKPGEIFPCQPGLDEENCTFSCEGA